MTWSTDKHYLAELDGAGLAVTPSMFIEVGDSPRFPDSVHGFVIKPAVGAGSRDVVRYPATPTAREAAADQIAALHARGRCVVVQPTLINVERHGEWPLIFLAGAFSHAAVRRVGLPTDGAPVALSAPEESRPAAPTPAMLELAERTMRVRAHCRRRHDLRPDRPRARRPGTAGRDGGRARRAVAVPAGAPAGGERVGPRAHRALRASKLPSVATFLLIVAIY